MKLYNLLYLPLLLGVVACQDPSFSIKGEIENADGKTIILEKPDHAGIWIPLDSAKLKSNGKFSFSQPAPAAPEVYRLSLDGNYVYFPIDSVENITLKASAPSFATSFTLSGSDNATAMERFEKELIAVSPYLNIPDSANNFKRRVFTKYLQDARGSVVSYYILTKTVGDQPLFNSDSDVRYIAAVATAFKQFRPDDPRVRLLEQAATEGMKRRSAANGKQTVIQAEEVAYFPISLPDENGNEVSLSSVVGGIPTLLIFADLSDSEAMKMNSEIKKLVDAGKVKVYHVGVDADRLTWSNAAKNLGWTTVYANLTAARELAAKYNVQDLPTIFVIDGAGNLTKRVSSISEL